MKRTFALILALALMLALAACTPAETTPTAEPTLEPTPAPTAEPTPEPTPEATPEATVLTDMLGREVALPAEVKTIVSLAAKQHGNSVCHRRRRNACRPRCLQQLSRGHR